MISGRSKFAGKWLELNSDIRFELKTIVLSTLASKFVEVRRIAGNCIAGICKIEFPRKEWLDLLDTLNLTSKNSDMNIRSATITTLGYIVQEIDSDCLDSSDINKILEAILQNLNANEDYLIRKECILALLYSIVLANSNFSGVQDRNYLMIAIYNALDFPEVELRTYAMQCIVEFARLYYDYLEDQIDKIQEICDKHVYIKIN